VLGSLIVICAATAELVPLSLAQALDLAQRHNPDLAVVQQMVPAARAGIDVARALPNPTVGFNVGPDVPQYFGLLDQRLPIFGQRGSAISAAEADVPVAQAQLAVSSNQLRAAVRRSYAVLALSQSQLELSRQTARLAQELAQLTLKRYQTGSAPQFEAEQGALVAKRAEHEVLDRTSLLEIARIRLAQVLGVPAKTPIQATDPLLPLPSVGSAEELLARAENHPDLQVARREREAAEARVQRERVAVRPVPTVSLQLEQFPSSLGVGLRAGMLFDAPVLSQNQGQIRTQQVQVAQAEARYSAFAHRLQADLGAARTRWASAVRRVRFFEEELVPAAVRVADLARIAYTVGRTPISNVLQAQRDLEAARILGLDAAGEAWAALADIEEASGARF